MEDIFKIIMRTLGMIAIIPLSIFIWFYYISPPAKTITTTKTDVLTLSSELDEITEDKTYVGNINYYSNEKKDGREMFEIKIVKYQSLTDAENAIKLLQDSNSGLSVETYSYGIQIFDDNFLNNIGVNNKFKWSSYKRTKKTSKGSTYHRYMKVEDSNLYVQGGAGETAVDGNTSVDDFDNFLVSSDNSIYRLKFKDELVKKKYKTWIFGSNKSYYNEMDINYFSYLMYDKISDLEKDGTFFITLDLSKIFDVEIYDFDNEKFRDPKSSENQNLFKFKINISSNGATKASQSIFGKINGDPEYNYLQLNEENELFWKPINIYNINSNTNGLELRYSEVYGGNVIRISDELASYLSSFDDMEINVDLNLDNTNIVGVDSNFFNNIEVKNFKITCSTYTTFYFLHNYNSTGSVEKIQHSDNVTLDFYNDNKIDTEVIYG